MIDVRKNITWINTIKAVCLLSVYYVHVQIYYGYRIEPLNWFVHAFYVNGFFFVSGYLLFRKQLTEPNISEPFARYALGGGKILINNLVYRLMIPSFLFSLIEFVPKHVIRGESITVSEFFFETFGGGTYWFTSSLVVAEMLVVVFLLFRVRQLWIYAIAGFIAVTCGIYLFDNRGEGFMPSHEIWAWRRGLVAYGYLVAGGLYWKYEKVIDRYLNLVVCLLLAIPLILCPRLQEAAQCMISTYEFNLFGFAYSLIIVRLLIAVCKLMPSNRMLTFVGQYSLCFYFLSGALPIVLGIIIHRLYPESCLFGYIIVLVLSVVASYSITYIFNQYTPWIFDIRKIKIEKTR